MPLQELNTKTDEGSYFLPDSKMLQGTMAAWRKAERAIEDFMIEHPEYLFESTYDPIRGGTLFSWRKVKQIKMPVWYP